MNTEIKSFFADNCSRNLTSTNQRVLERSRAMSRPTPDYYDINQDDEDTTFDTNPYDWREGCSTYAC